MRWTAAVLCLLAVAMSSASAVANPPPPPRVAVTVQRDAALEARLRDELDSAGYPTVSLGEGDVVSSDDLALDDDIAIVLLVHTHAEGYEVWLQEPATGSTVIREVMNTLDLSAVALRAVELVRVAVLEQKRRGAPPEAPNDGPAPATPQPSVPVEPVPPPRPAPQPAPPRMASPPATTLPSPVRYPYQPEPPAPPPLGSVELCTVWFHDVQGGDSSAGIEASGGVFYPRRLQTRVRARYMLSMPTLIMGETGTIDTSMGQVGASIALHSTDPAAIVSPFLEAGVDFLWLYVRGTPNLPLLRGLRKNAYGAYPHVGPGISVGSDDFPLRLRAHVSIGANVPRLRLILLDEGQTWGWPVVEGALGVQYLIP